MLDECRGMTDAAGTYFYSLETSGEFEVLDCFSGTIERQSRDEWSPRLEVYGNVLERELAPIPMEITVYSRADARI